MPRLTIKTSDKNLIKVASFEGKRKDWCSYWIVPEIPASGVFRVPAGFRFRVGTGGPVDSVFISSADGTTNVSLAEGDVVILTAPSFKNPNLEHSLEEMVYNVEPGLRVVNQAYFKHWWVPAEGDDKSIPTRNAFAEHAPSKAATHKPDPVWHPLENSVFDSEASAQSHPDFKDFDHIVINQKNPSNRHLHLMRMLLREKGYAVVKEGEAIPSKDDSHEQENTFSHAKIYLVNPSKDELQLMERILRQQGRAVIDTLNPSKDDLSLIIKLLMERSYLIYRKGETGFSDLAWMKSLLRAEGYHVMTQEERLHLRDMNYESGYAKGLAEGRRQVSESTVIATRAYQVGFDAGRMVERLGILKGEESNDRNEAELPATGDSETEATRIAKRKAMRGYHFQHVAESSFKSESRPRETAVFLHAGEPSDSLKDEHGRPRIFGDHDASTPERNENEKDNAQATDSQG